MAFTYKGKKVNFLEMKKGSKTTRVYDLNNYNNLIKAGYSDASTTTKSTTTPTTTTPAKTEEKLSYTDLEDRDGTIYNKKTGKGYPTPSALAADLGITPSEIKWDKIQGDKIEYSDLENQNGTIVNTKTGKRYSTPTELAADLDISPQQIDWTKVSDTPTTPAPDPNPFDPTDDGAGDGGAGGGDGAFDASGMDPEFIDYLTSMGIDPSNVSQDNLLLASISYESMKTMEQTGQVVDPELVITEEHASAFLNELETNPLVNKQFLTFAQKELGPYYQQKIDFAKQDLTRELGDIKRQYGEGIEDIGEASAEKGLAFSGIRQKQEQELGASAQRTAGGIGRTAERYYGSTAFGGLDIPQIGTTPLYQLSGGITGELEKEQEVAEKTYAQDIEKVYRERKAGREYI